MSTFPLGFILAGIASIIQRNARVKGTARRQFHR